MRIKWTGQQRRAIAARGSDILVTASAGTGKTAVLSGRCVDIVSDKSGRVDVSNILVLTFTDAAAEQMRSRIAEQLRTVFTETGDWHLRQQLILLQASDISTIHSFCKRLITEYFYELGLDPTFSVIDADEAQLFKAETLEKTIDWAWQQTNLSQGLTELLRGRDLQENTGFLTKIIGLSDFLDSVVLRKSWYQKAVQITQAMGSLSGGLGQKQIIAEKLQRILKQLLHAQKMFESENTGGDWSAKLQATHIEPVKHCLEIVQSGNWNRCAELIRDFSKPKTPKPRDVPEPIAELLQKTAKKAIESFKSLSDLSALSPDYLEKIGNAASRQTKVLIELIKKFDQLYSQAKRSLNCMDFADLEHNALRLLADVESEDDELSPSQTALSLRQKYKYIFVDEYQDINPIQQAILNMLSSQDNVFVVGDVKQSIYAFRGAEPNIFAENLRLASLDPANASNKLRVDLNVNFRSTKGILDFVNKLFSRIMSAAFAQIEYDDSAKLRPALANSSDGRASNGQRPAVEFHILDETDKDEDSENGQVSGSEQSDDLSVITSRQRQAALIAQRIRQMVGADTGKAEFQIYDTRQNCLRDLQYSDIVILMRSLAKKANDYVEVLRLAGLPVSCQAAAGYFEATEITDILSLLKVLDNPQRDIELAAVLRSPFFTVCDSELTKIRIYERTSEQSKNFYCCVHRYSESGPDTKLASELKSILKQIDCWRNLARRGRLADLIWQI
jgi:ATP-dependent helicase/nuclease subunit A